MPVKISEEVFEQVRGGVLTLSFPRLGHPTLIRQGISTRVGGVSGGNYKSLNISYKVSDEPLKVKQNRRLLSASLEMDLDRLVYLHQVHSDKVFQLTEANRPKPGEPLGDGDAIITDLPGVPITISVADCLPILFYDQAHKAIGLAHAGWRGTVARIAVKTLEAMKAAYGTEPSVLKAVLGPAIGPCCYEVGKDVKEQFETAFPDASELLEQSDKDHWKLNIPEANARQLIGAGMDPDRVIRSGLCTVEHLDWFYSHRAEAGPGTPTGRFGAFLMLVEPS